MTEASIHTDLGPRGPAGRGAAFDDVIVDVDGYLCSLKDAQIRGGLHTLGLVPEGDMLVDLVLAITRLPHGSIPSLRAAVADELGLSIDEPRDLDAIEARVPRTWSRPPSPQRPFWCSERGPGHRSEHQNEGSATVVEWVVRVAGAATRARRATRSPTCSPASRGGTCRRGPPAR